MRSGRVSRIALALLVLVVVLVGLRLWPKTELRDRLGSSTPIYARHGELLRLTLADDQQYRLWTPLDQIAPNLIQSTLLYEDSAFWWHPGINPAAIVRSVVHMMRGGRREGASTISMQLARRLEHIDSRSLKGKFLQAWTALVLELRYSKRDILEAYLNSTPYGGNIEGIGTASLIYFNHDAATLTMSESLTLAVIPQNPTQRLPTHYSAEDGMNHDLEAARGRLWAQWKKRYPEQAARHDADALMRPVALTRSSLPFLAPHLTDMLLSSDRSARAKQHAVNVLEADGAIHTTLDLPMQHTLERIMKQYLASRAESGLSNASAFLLDASTMEVRALVGSADYSDARLQGQFNGTQGKRSPGSTLKPFIYALALDQGLLHPRTILKDSPVSFAGFSPENYDGQFVGPVSAQDALIRSRNIPAVSLSAKLNRPNLHQFLQLNKISRLKSEAHYGLALALGGGEVTPEELARLYAVLANDGVAKPIKYVRRAPSSKGHDPVDADAPKTFSASGLTHTLANDKDALRLLSPAAAFITLDMLRQTPRPDTLAPARPPIAWKTGTSWSYRDAWTAGVFGRYVLVVWVGDFSGKSHPAFVGIDAAAPLFLRMVDALRAQGLASGDAVRPRPDDLQQVQVCAATGDLPDGVCPVKVKTWFIAGKSPINISQLHASVQIDQATGQIICDADSASATQASRTILVERWGSDMRRIFDQSGLPRRQLNDTACEQNKNMQSSQPAMAPLIRSPQRGVRYVLGPTSDPLTLRADAASGMKTLFWFADDSFIGQSVPGEPITWRPPSTGHYVLRVVDDLGQVDIRDLDIDDPLSQVPGFRRVFR